MRGWNNSSCWEVPVNMVSMSNERSGPRNHSCVGMSKPTFFRSGIDGGSLPFINSLRTNFWQEPRILSASGKVAANSTIL
jgi:hypothetical protein